MKSWYNRFFLLYALFSPAIMQASDAKGAFPVLETEQNCNKNTVLYGFSYDRCTQDSKIKELFLQQYKTLSCKDKQKALLIAVEHSNSDLCHFLLNPDYAIDVNYHYSAEILNHTLLGNARSTEIAQILIDKGALVCNNTETLFNLASIHGSDYKERLLLYYAHGAPFFDKKRWTIAHYWMSHAAAISQETILQPHVLQKVCEAFSESITPEILYHVCMHRPPGITLTVCEYADKLTQSISWVFFGDVMDSRLSQDALTTSDNFFRDKLSLFCGRNNLPGDIFNEKSFTDKLSQKDDVEWDKKTALTFIPFRSLDDQQQEAIKIFFSLVNENNEPVLSQDDKQKALAVAAAYGDESLCDFILSPEHGVTINYQLPNDRVHPTALSRVKECALAQKFITQYGATVAHDTRLLFNTVLRTNNVDLVRLYAHKGASLVNHDGETIFHTLALADCAGKKPLSTMAEAIWDARPNDCYDVMQRSYTRYAAYGTALEWTQKIAHYLPKDHPRALYRDFLAKKVVTHMQASANTVFDYCGKMTSTESLDTLRTYLEEMYERYTQHKE